MLGKYPYTPYENDYYQIYMSFNVDIFGYDTSSVVLDSAVLYYNGAQIRLDDKDIVGILKSAKTGNYIQDSEMDRLTGLKFTSSSISGDSFKQKISKWMKKEETQTGIVLGYGMLGNSPGYIKGLKKERIRLVLQYHYQ